MRVSHPAAAYGVSAIANEAQLLMRCDHPCIIRCFGAGLSPPRPFLVLECMPYSLEALIYDAHQTLSLDKVRSGGDGSGGGGGVAEGTAQEGHDGCGSPTGALSRHERRHEGGVQQQCADGGVTPGAWCGCPIDVLPLL